MISLLVAATLTSMLISGNVSTWKGANPSLFFGSYPKLFLNFVRAKHAEMKHLHMDKACNFLDIGGRYGKSKAFAGGCNYWIIDINRKTSVEQHVLGCDIESLATCDIKDLPSFDIVHSRDTFEHLRQPWEAMHTINALTKPGSVLMIAAPFAWRYHAVRIGSREATQQGAVDGGGYGDYLRYTHSELDFLAKKFANFTSCKSGYDDSKRRKVAQGHSPWRLDGVKFDRIGGWLESIEAFFIGRKEAPCYA